MGDLSVSIATELVNFMLVSLKEVIREQAHLISDAKNQVEMLEKNILLLKEFLVDSTKLPAEDIVIRSLLRDIREGVYETEDTVDSFVSAVEGKNLALKVFFIPGKLLSMAKQIQNVGQKVNSLCTEVKEHIKRTNHKAAQDGGLEEYDHEAPSSGQDNIMVGFEAEERELIGRLTTETDQLDVVPIIGMTGLGKTRLAANIFHHPTIQEQGRFSKRIWVSVSNATIKKVFLTILRKLGMLKKGIHHKSEDELGRLVAAHLEHEKFLVVLDDVWTAGDWKKLQVGFPKGHKMGKVLITSCHEEVARVTTNPDRPHVKLDTLTPEEGWRLLQLRVFGDRKCPQDLECSGKLIVEQCGRLPMAIVDIAEILAKKVSESDQMIAKKDAWEQVCDGMGTFLNDDPTISGTKKLLSSYDKLPYHLRACFLYLGMFPEGYEIPVSTLIQMWIAEGFVQHKDGLSLEVTAGNYLDELISRSLVSVGKRKPNGRPKTCRIHYLLRHFCKTEAGKERENFLQELKKSSIDGDFHPPIPEIENYRRLCIYSNVLSFILLKPSGRRVRSFACFSGAPITLDKKNASTIPAAFKLLRVLDVEPIKFTKIPKDLYLLVHLRYIVLSLDLPVLPADFSKLRNIQTLTLYTTFHTLEIKANILKMIQLRHFKTNASATLAKTGKSSKGGEKLQTLGTISPKSCTQEFFDRVCNLNKLSVRGQLALLLDGKDESFHFGKLRKLKKLKLINDVHSEDKFLLLPQKSRFPGNLRSLTLSATSLEWSSMNILGSLDQLEVLKLKDNAVVGRSWETKDGGFRYLQFLHIESKDLAVWQASGKHFPRLRCLELWNCEKLTQVPFELAHIQTFERLQLCNSSSAADSAKRILKEKRKQEEEQTIKISVFNLSFSLDE